MKNILKISGVVILSYLLKFGVEVLSEGYLHLIAPLPTKEVISGVLSFIILLFIFSLLWCLFFRDKVGGTQFIKQIKFKKTYLILVIIFALLNIISSASFVMMNQILSQKEDKYGVFLADNVYENTKYHFRLTYPKGSIFANANPQSGFVTRFFLPDGQVISNDQENIGIYIQENTKDLEGRIKDIEERFSKNGKIDIKEVQFGGQKGYRIILTTDYSAEKGTKELFYITVKNNVSFELNYFPVSKNISAADEVATSFQFTQ